MSEQMDNLKARYGVTTKQRLIWAIMVEQRAETGEAVTLRDAELLLDGMLEAEYQRIAGGAYDRPADSELLPSEEERALYDDRPAIERYGTEEHEAWLIEMERMED